MENSTKIVAVLSLAATIITAIVSFGQYKSTEKVELLKIEFQKATDRGKLDLEREKASHSIKIEMGDFIFKKIELLSDPKRNGMATAMLRFTLEEKRFQDLLTYISQYGDISARPIAKKVLIETDRRAIKTNSWQGTWSHRFVGSSNKSYEGRIEFKVSLEGVVNGTFKIENSKITGRIKGRLSKDGTILKGTWENSAGKNGGVLFNRIKENEKLSFSGVYSMFDTNLDPQSPNKWFGEKQSDLKR